MKTIPESSNSTITQTYCIFKEKTAILNVAFMHNSSGNVQLSVLFMCNLPFPLKLFLFQKYFFSFLFHKQNPKPERGKKNICCQKSDTSCFTLVKDKMSSSENTRLALVHLHSLLNKTDVCFAVSFPHFS